jgi:hypothetical protein
VELGSDVWNKAESGGRGARSGEPRAKSPTYLAAALGNRTFGIPFDIAHVSIGHRRRRAKR